MAVETSSYPTDSTYLQQAKMLDHVPLSPLTDVQDDEERDAFVQPAVLHGQRHRQAPDEHHVGLLHVQHAHLGQEGWVEAGGL